MAQSVGYLRPNEFSIDGDLLSVTSYPDATGRSGRSITQMTARFKRISGVNAPSECVLERFIDLAPLPAAPARQK